MQSIADWLAKLGMPEYAASFEANRIDVGILPDLTDQDLEKLGVLLGDRRKMLRAIRDGPQSTAVRDRPTPPVPSRDEAERRQLTVIFCDLVGSTALSAKLDPEDLRGIIRDYHRCCAAVVERNGGYVAKYMGDGVLGYFGYPQAHEHDAERAVHAGLALADAVPNITAPAINASLQVRIGIATGLVVVGDLIGKGGAQEQTVVGETPNLAARLQAIAEPGSVVVAENTRKLLGDLFEFQGLEPLDLKGISGPVRAWTALRPGHAESRFDALHGAGLTKLAGRKEEMELVLRRWRKASRGEGQVVLLSGEPGIGKSRIAVAVLEQIAAEPHTTLRYFCSPQHTDSALYPIAQRIERAAGLRHTDRPEAKLEKLNKYLLQTSTSPEDAALVAEMMSLPNDGNPALVLAPEQRKRKTIDALMSQLVRLSARRPILVIFEDIHWIDPTTLEVLDLFVSRAPGLRALLLITFRPEFKAPWDGEAHVTSLTLTRLPAREAAAIIAGLVGAEKLSDDLTAEIVERTDGIPLFVEEMTKAVLEAETEAAGRRTAAMTPSSGREIPASLHASLLARLDRLAQAKEVAQIGAAIGREFSFALLTAVAQRDGADLIPALDRLVDAGLLFRQGAAPDARYLFKHALVQDVAYDTLLRERRQQLHARIATVLDRQFGARDSEPELLARHYGLAAMPEEAIGCWQRAGERAARTSANKEAITHFRNALQLLTALPDRAARADQELGLLLALGPALMTTRSSVAPEIGQVYARARELASARQQAAELFPTVWGAWLVAFSRGEFSTAARLVDELFGIAGASDDAELTLQAHHAAWPSMWVAGALEDARGHIQKAFSLYRRELHGQQYLHYGGHDPGVCAYGCNAVISATMGYPDRALDDVQKALALARSLDHPPTLLQALWFAAELHQIRREPAKVAAYVHESLPLLSDHGSPVGFANAAMLDGWARVMQGDREKGLAVMRNGLEDWRNTDSKFHITYRTARAAEAFFIAGEHEASLQLIAGLEGTADRWFAPELYRLKGELLLNLGERDGAEACFRRALDAAQAQGARLLALRTATSLARFFESRGRRAEGQALLAPIYFQFDDGLETADLRNARTWLGLAT